MEAALYRRSVTVGGQDRGRGQYGWFSYRIGVVKGNRWDLEYRRRAWV